MNDNNIAITEYKGYFPHEWYEVLDTESEIQRIIIISHNSIKDIPWDELSKAREELINNDKTFATPDYYRLKYAR